MTDLYKTARQYALKRLGISEANVLGTTIVKKIEEITQIFIAGAEYAMSGTSDVIETQPKNTIPEEPEKVEVKKRGRKKPKEAATNSSFDF